MRKTLIFFIIIISTINPEVVTTESGTKPRRSHLSVRFLNNISSRLAEWERINSLPTLNSPNRVKSRGYPFETQHIITKDGYKLQLHRIPDGINDDTALLDHKIQQNSSRPVVLLGHGSYSSSLTWLGNYNSTNNLGFLLADAGYDVWLANSRGTPYSSTHVNYTNKNSSYWDFSQHELGVYDLSATIDYILNETKENQIYYVGFSLGSASYLILMSEQPNYNDKIRLAVLMAPSPAIRGLDSSRILPKIYPILKSLQSVIGPFPVPSESVSIFSNYVYIDQLCKERLIPSKRLGICWLLRSRLEGFFNQQKQPIMDQYSLVSSNIFPSTSSKLLIHIYQCAFAEKFQNYDYGEGSEGRWRNNSRISNMKVYGTSNPPEYDLSKVTSPISIMYADGDTLVKPTNVKLLASKLPNLYELYRIPMNGFGHTSFVNSKDLYQLVYQHLLDILSKH